MLVEPGHNPVDLCSVEVPLDAVDALAGLQLVGAGEDGLAPLLHHLCTGRHALQSTTGRHVYCR
jgi:hypothetical protein